jgi:hypothetical protein
MEALLPILNLRRYRAFDNMAIKESICATIIGAKSIGSPLDAYEQAILHYHHGEKVCDGLEILGYG